MEILATILIVSLGILVLARTQILSTKGTAFNQEATTAALTAQKKVEELKGADFDSVVNGSSAEGGMMVSWHVVTQGASPFRTKDVTVTVTWASKNISLYTIIGE